MSNQIAPRRHLWRPPYPSRKPPRPSSLLPRRFDLTPPGGTPSFIRYARPVKCSSEDAAVALNPPPTVSAGAHGSSSFSSTLPSASTASSSSPPPTVATAPDTVSTAAATPDTASTFAATDTASISPATAATDDVAADSGQKYDVFISFRGEDTGENFTSHLYDALHRAGIEAFIDNEELETGEEIGPALSDAIERSKISVVVFSKSYASSKWCLSELAKIVECRKTRGQIVLPIFYHVEPKEVRWQTGSFELAFARYEKVPESSKMVEKVKLWRKALTDVANISGFDSRDVRPEAKLVHEVVEHVLQKLESLSLRDDEHLVGVQSQVKAVEKLLGNGSGDVRSVGIWGRGGVGKTAIAYSVLNRVYRQFESYCFLANVREESDKHGLISLRDELLRQVLDQTDIHIPTPDIGSRFLRDRLRRRKVLIVLDDVSNTSQLEFLIKDPTYFGPGSRIIITTRDKDLLKSVDEMYEVKELAEIDALELFSLCAFKQNDPPEEYLQISKSFVAYAEGLPLAIKVLGSCLRMKSIKYWESALNRFRRVSDETILKTLRVSYDALNDEDKAIFLSIACLFNGKDRNYATSVVGEGADVGIQALIDRSLITLSEDRLRVHDLLENMAKEIIRLESPREPLRRRFLWSSDDCEVLALNKETEAVEGISLNLSEVEEMRISSLTFERMPNLKFLKICKCGSDGGDSKLHLQGDFPLPRKMRYLRWDYFPLQTLQTFSTSNLVELEMINSRLEYLWKAKVFLPNLRGIDLSYSLFLKELPDLSRAPKLVRIILRACINLTNFPSLKGKLKHVEFLDLSECTNLKAFPDISWNIKKLLLAGTTIEEIPPSIENFYQLIILDMKNCKMLRTVPSVGQKLGKLEVLDLSGCPNVTSFPEISWNPEVLLLSETAIEKVPSAIKYMEKLELLDLKNCPRLKSLPSSICELTSLQELNLSGSSNFSSFPEIQENMDRLNYLSLDGTAIKELPASIENLTGIYSLDLENCKNLTSLPDGLCKLKSLEDLNLSGCSNLESLPQGLGDLESLQRLRANGCRSQVVNFLVGSARSLRILHLSGCGIKEFPDGLVLLSSLKELDLSRNCIKRIPSSFKQLHELQCLHLSCCEKLQILTELPDRLTKVTVLNCKSLEMVALNVSSELQLYPLENVETYVFANCPKLKQNALDNIKAFAKHRIRVLASHLSIILNFRGCPTQDGWMTPQQMQYLLSHLYEYGDFQEALRGLYKAFSNEELLSEISPSSLLGRMLHDFHERCRLDFHSLLGFFSLIAHIYLSCQGKPSTNFCLPGTDIPDWFCHQKDGSSIALTVHHPINSNNHSILVGFAMCVLVAFDDYNDDKGISIKCNRCFYSNQYGTYDGSSYLRGWDGKKGDPVLVEGNYMFLGYDSSLLVGAAKGTNKFVRYSQDLVKISIKFYAVDEDGNPLSSCIVQKCGIQPLYINDMTKSLKEPLGGQDVLRGLPRSFPGFLTEVLGSLDLFGAISLGILNILGDLSVEVVHQGGYVYIVIKCQNAGLPIGLQVFNVHLGAPPLTVKLIEPPENSQDPRKISIEFSYTDGNNNCPIHQVKKCEIRPLENHVMLIDRCAT